MRHRYMWCWAMPRDQPWLLQDTRDAYQDWENHILHRQNTDNIVPYPVLPSLDSDPAYTLRELTVTIAWVAGVKALLYPVPV